MTFLRILVMAVLFCSLYGQSSGAKNKPANTPHESLPNVVYDGQGNKVPAKGYRWANESVEGDYSVVPEGNKFITSVRIYNLQTGEVMDATLDNKQDGHGFIAAESKVSGEKFKGEFSYEISGDSSGSVVSPPWIKQTGFLLGRKGVLYGSATAVGNKGTILDIVFSTDPKTGHGTGVAKDNKEVLYKLQF
ncbi:MAG: hypothetical protein V4507_08205 [Verrucomicrobiota bacterium]